jgi:chitin synthase
MSSGLAERLQIDIISLVLHSDVSSGTKGGNKVQTSNGKYTVDEAVPTAEADINAAYDVVIHVLSTKPPKEEKKVDVAATQDDLYSSFWAKYAVSIPHS